MTRSRLMTGLCVGLLCGAALAAPPPEPELTDPDSGYFSPRTALVIRLPGNFSGSIASWYLEVDQTDVSALTRQTPEALTYTPAIPLAPGQHVLRLVVETESGELREAGVWTFDVRQSAWFEAATLEGSADLAATWPAAHHDPSMPEPDPEREGSLQVSGSLNSASVSLEGHTGLLHHSNADIMPEDRRLELADSQLLLSRGEQRIIAGDQSLSGDSLALSELYRRGLAGQFSLLSGALRVEPFVLSTPQLSGFDGGLGITRPDQRTLGTQVMLASQSLPGAPLLTLTWLAGEGNPSGDFTYTPPLESRVLASDLILSVPGTALAVHAGQAISRTDFDTTDSTLPRFTDEAYRLGIRWQPSAPEDGGWESAGVEWMRVQPDFYSPGNTGLPADKTGVLGQARWQGPRLGVEIGLSREEDNVTGDNSRPVLREDRVSLLASRNLPDAASGGGLWQNVTLDTGLEASRQQHVHIPSGWGGYPVDQTLRALTLQLSGNPDWLQWQAGYRWERFEDDTAGSADYRRNQPELSLALPIPEDWSLNARLSWDRTHQIGPDAVSRALTTGWGISGQLPDQGLDLELSHELNRTLTGDASMDEYIHTLSLSVNRTWQSAQANQPALTLFARGSYRDDRSAAASQGDGYQVLVGIRLQSTFRYGEEGTP